MAEKNYVLYKTDAISEQVKAKLAELAGNLDSVDKIAEQFNDADLAKKSKDVRGLVAQFAKLYDDGVAALKSNKAGEQIMSAKGQFVGDEAAKYMARPRRPSTWRSCKNSTSSIVSIRSPGRRALHSRSSRPRRTL